MMLDAEKDSLGAYILTFFPGMMFAPHHKRLIDAMMRVERGELKRVIVSISPRHGKSLIVSEHFPAWYFGRDPSRQIAVASYGQGLSETFGKKVQTQIESTEFKSIFPEFKAIKSTQKEINTDRRGVYVATSIGGSLTGKGANCFHGDTMITIDSHGTQKPIKDIRVGDYVRTVDLKTHRCHRRKVVATLRRPNVEYGDLEISRHEWLDNYKQGFVPYKVIKCTADHPFYCRINQEYLSAGVDQFYPMESNGYDADTHEYYRAKWEKTGEVGDVYDIQVTKEHNFIADGFLAHNCLIIDDPVKDRQEAESQRMRDAAWEWYTSTARTRLMKNGAIVLVLTRWHEDDLAGRILKNDDKKEWEYIRIPAIGEDGNALWPEMFDLNALLSIRRDIGPHEFQCLYQNDPKPKEGNVLPVAHMQYCEALPEKFSRIIQVVDSAIKDGKQNDYTVISTFGELKGSMYEIDQWRDKVQYPALKKAVELNYKKHRPSVIVIEDKASGQQLIQELSASYPVKAAKAVLDKVQRAGTLADCMSVGRCYLQKGLERNNVTISEMASFPSGANDDIVDTWAYGAIELVRADILPLLADVFDEAKNLYKIVGNPPYAWRYFRSMCYSAQEPSACLWWAVANDEQNYCGRFWVDAQIVVFAEMSWSKGSTPANVASKIKQMESSMSLANCGAGPAGAAGDVPLCDEDNGPSPMIEFSKLGAKFVRAIEDEPTGWAQVRSRLFAGDLVVSESCPKLIEQIRHTTANPDKKEYADDYQQIPNLKALRFICNAFKKRPIKQAPQKIDVAKSIKTILGRVPNAKI